MVYTISELSSFNRTTARAIMIVKICLSHLGNSALEEKISNVVDLSSYFLDYFHNLCDKHDADIFKNDPHEGRYLEKIREVVEDTILLGKIDQWEKLYIWQAIWFDQIQNPAQVDIIINSERTSRDVTEIIEKWDPRNRWGFMNCVEELTFYYSEKDKLFDVLKYGKRRFFIQTFSIFIILLTLQQFLKDYTASSLYIFLMYFPLYLIGCFGLFIDKWYFKSFNGGLYNCRYKYLVLERSSVENNEGEFFCCVSRVNGYPHIEYKTSNEISSIDTILTRVKLVDNLKEKTGVDRLYRNNGYNLWLMDLQNFELGYIFQSEYSTTNLKDKNFVLLKFRYNRLWASFFISFKMHILEKFGMEISPGFNKPDGVNNSTWNRIQAIYVNCCKILSLHHKNFHSKIRNCDNLLVESIVSLTIRGIKSEEVFTAIDLSDKPLQLTKGVVSVEFKKKILSEVESEDKEEEKEEEYVGIEQKIGNISSLKNSKSSFRKNYNMYLKDLSQRRMQIKKRKEERELQKRKNIQDKIIELEVVEKDEVTDVEYKYFDNENIMVTRNGKVFAVKKCSDLFSRKNSKVKRSHFLEDFNYLNQTNSYYGLFKTKNKSSSSYMYKRMAGKITLLNVSIRLERHKKEDRGNYSKKNLKRLLKERSEIVKKYGTYIHDLIYEKIVDNINNISYEDKRYLSSETEHFVFYQILQNELSNVNNQRKIKTEPKVFHLKNMEGLPHIIALC